MDNITSSEGNRTGVFDTSLRLVPDETRSLFYWLILTISIVTLIGNALAIRSILKRKCKNLQKTCIITLAVADIFSVVLFAVNFLDTLAHELMIWNYGEFMCYFIPMGQVLGTTASSIALLIIALDRYQNVIYALSKRWDPNIWLCLYGAFMVWAISAATAYPMYINFDFIPIQIVYVSGDTPTFEDAYICITTSKSDLKIYYITMAILIFLPIITIFIWFYYKIAALVWRHRKPLSSRTMYQQELENSYSTKSTETSSKTNLEKNPKSIMKKTKNVQVERKIRTFKIVVALMLTFVICRLPYWVFFVVRLIRIIPGKTSWNVHFALTTLNILNCALNPFLYTFLNETIYALKKINDFMCKICCCCFSNAEFEAFERENPFALEYHEHRTPQVVMEHQKNASNSRVKFVDVAHLTMYQNNQPKY